MLKYGGDLNTEDSHQKTALFYAVDSNNIENSKKIISSGDTASHICNDRRTALHDAAERGVCEIAQALIDAGVDVNSQNWNNVTPLHLAAHYGRFDMVQLLLENGAAIDAQDDDGNSPLHIAAKHNHADICRYLISAGADHMAVNKDNLKAAEIAPEDLKKQLNDFIIETLMNKSRGIDVSSSNLGICVFCQKEQANYTFLPCHHVSLCEDCYQENKDKLKFCPMCRKTLKLVKKDN